MRTTRWIALTLVMLALCSLSAGAQARESSGGYAVRALLPENQWNDEVTYFDLMVKPEQRQVLQVVILNRADEEIEVAVEANTASSNINGAIVFLPPDERDESMVVDFAQIVKPVEPVVTVPANGEAVAKFEVTMPKEPYEGVVYGGLSFMKLHQGEDDSEAGGMAIRNVFCYVIGVRLYESEIKVEPEFELLGAEMATNDMPALIVHLRNPRPVIARDITVRVTVYPDDGDGEPVARMDDHADMAPHAAMPLRIYLEDGVSLTPGTHRVEVEISFEGRTWRQETSLIVP